LDLLDFNSGLRLSILFKEADELWPTVFSPLIDPIFRSIRFILALRRYKGNYRIRTLTCLDQISRLSFAQLT